MYFIRLYASHLPDVTRYKSQVTSPPPYTLFRKLCGVIPVMLLNTFPK